MHELLAVQDGGRDDKDENGAVNGAVVAAENGKPEDGSLAEEEVEGIRRRTATYLLGEGRCERGRLNISLRRTAEQGHTGLGGGIEGGVVVACFAHGKSLLLQHFAGQRIVLLLV